MAIAATHPLLMVGYAEAMRACLSEDEEERATARENSEKLLAYAGCKIGAVLLAARDEEDLRDRVEQMIDSRAFQHIQELWKDEWDSVPAKCATCAHTQRAPEKWPVPFRERLKMRLWFGKSATETIREAWSFGTPIAGAIARIQASGRGNVLAAESLESISTLPPAEARSLIRAIKGTAAAYALSHAGHGQPIRRWLAKRLAEWYRDGSREYLRLLASDPDAGVSEEVIPVAERLPLQALREENDRVRSGFAALAKRRGPRGKNPPVSGVQ